MKTPPGQGSTAKLASRSAKGTPRRRFITAGLAAAGAVATVKAPARPAQYSFKVGSDQTLDHPSTIRLAQMWSAVQRESNGRIHVDFFPASVLGSSAAMFSQLRVGAVEFNYLSPATMSAVVPLADIPDIGFAFKDSDDGFRVMDGTLGEFVRQETLNKGIYTLKRAWNAGMLQIGSIPRPIVRPDDMHNFKVRVNESKIQLDLFKEIGAIPTPLTFGAVYTSLQTKLIDGVATPLVAMETSKFYEVFKYISLTNHAWVADFLVANADYWKSLPSDLQEIIERNNTKYALLERADTRQQTATLVGKFRNAGFGVNVVDQAPFRARLKNYFQTWSSVFGATGWGLLENALGHKLT